nr:hypothetical protein Iba_chr13aCG6580 [Ipomoea batatas]
MGTVKGTLNRTMSSTLSDCITPTYCSPANFPSSLYPLHSLATGRPTKIASTKWSAWVYTNQLHKNPHMNEVTSHHTL